MVTDTSRNMLAMLNVAGLKSIVCMAHKLHLVVHDTLGLGSQMLARLVEQKNMLKPMMPTIKILSGGRELDINATNWLALSQMVAK
ncbi:hypothetical protein JRQ81_019459 [Phrynocephalus forsythii]|uniref:Uncharacterized protein n=1 Tax=Phrynocephalus forsythii TaxID=171643 RepID=A0A9Q0XMQ2_9SAUR|nr:hypothetical protein JRQ81_019459 [Phrynocephalus forsythii]